MTTRFYSNFRSEEMSLCQIFMQKDATYSCICELGEAGVVQFNNMNEDTTVRHMPYVHQISQCNEMLTILDYISQEVTEAGIPIAIVDDEEIPLVPKEMDIIKLQRLLDNVKDEISEISRNYVVLRKKYFQELEINAMLEKAHEFFSDPFTLAWSDSAIRNVLHDTNELRSVTVAKDSVNKLSYLTGTIPVEKFFAFERMLWRVSRGNAFLRHAEIEKGLAGKDEKKFVFMVFFVGETLEKKVRKICEGFRASLYQCPESSRERIKQLESMETKLKDLQFVVEKTDQQRRRLLTTVANDISLWRIKTKKAMAVYYVMNKLALAEAEKYMIAEGWIPKADIPVVRQALNRGARRSGTPVHPIITEIKKKDKVPPTYRRTNRLSQGFQMLIDSYGIGSYRELSPTPFTIVSFPFLFAVMFGDMGQGAMLMLFSGLMVRNEKSMEKIRNKNEIFKIIFEGRYIILAMGFFSVYTGTIYNECFSKCMNLFGSAWKVHYNLSTVYTNRMLQLDPAKSLRTYPCIFGLDPIYDTFDEKAVVVINSFKMKISIIIGVVHMFLGLALAVWNSLYFNDYVELFGSCIPHMVFFSLFGYMGFLIFFKWIFYSASNKPPYDSACAPSILNTIIDMVLFKKSSSTPEGCNYYMFEYQGLVQNIILVLAFLSIPVMLFSKPIYVYWKKQQKVMKKPKTKPSLERRVTFSKSTDFKSGRKYSVTAQIIPRPSIVNDNLVNFIIDSTDDDEQYTDYWKNLELSEVFINQIICTIENILGSISHTASYLRLWALSLAHEQLSEVLWTMVMHIGLKSKDWIGGILIAFSFCIWCSIMVALLIVMEGLSAFLHTLRLHWVEFQSKFYNGTGVKFKPFDFKTSIETQEDDY